MSAGKAISVIQHTNNISSDRRIHIDREDNWLVDNLFGLGYQYWKEVVSVLHSIIPVYDKVNMAISLGKANKYRLKDSRFN